MSETNTTDVIEGSSTSQNGDDQRVPLTRLNKEIEKRKELEAKLESLELNNDPKPQATDDNNISVADLAKQVKAEIAKEARVESFFGNLAEGMPKPDMDEVQAYAKKEGLDIVRAYKEMYEDDILDYKLKSRLQANNGILPERGQEAGSSTFDADELKKIAASGDQKAFDEYVARHGL